MNTLDANIRNTKTKGDLSAIRDKGGVPAIIYGGETQNEKVAISKKLLKVLIEKENFSFTSIHKSKANMATYGNILLGGIPGALIDGGSGKGYDYLNYLINGLNCRN